METNMSKMVRYLVSLLEILGGISGIALMVYVLAVNHINLAALIVWFITVGIYLLSIIAGVRLFKGKSGGRTASIIVQALQIPKIISPAFIFMFSIGLDFWVNIIISPGGDVNAGFQLRTPAFSQIFIAVSGAPIGLGVSVTSVIFLFLLIKYGSDKKLEFINAKHPDESSSYKTSYS